MFEQGLKRHDLTSRALALLEYMQDDPTLSGR